MLLTLAHHTQRYKEKYTLDLLFLDLCIEICFYPNRLTVEEMLLNKEIENLQAKKSCIETGTRRFGAV